MELFGVRVSAGGVAVGRGGGVFETGMGCGVSEAGGVITLGGVTVGGLVAGFGGMGVAERVGVVVSVAVGVCDGLGVLEDDDDGVGCVSGDGLGVGSGGAASLGSGVCGSAVGLTLVLAGVVGDFRSVRPERISCSVAGRAV